MYKNSKRYLEHKTSDLKKNSHAVRDRKQQPSLRKGEVGDWKNYLTPMMASCLDQITEQKLKNYGMTFNV